MQTVAQFSDEAVKEIMDFQTEIRAFKDWQVIYSVQTSRGKTAEEFASMLGVSKTKILRVIQLYNKHGRNWRIYGQWGGRRRQRCHLSLEVEKALMKSLEEEALTGKVLTFRHLKKKVDLFAGKEVSDDYIWDLFSRHGWRKKAPRQHHPKVDKAAREEYKKNQGKCGCQIFRV